MREDKSQWQGNDSDDFRSRKPGVRGGAGFIPSETTEMCYMQQRQPWSSMTPEPLGSHSSGGGHHPLFRLQDDVKRQSPWALRTAAFANTNISRKAKYSN